jgi:hypothetical protein
VNDVDSLVGTGTYEVQAGSSIVIKLECDDRRRNVEFWFSALLWSEGAITPDDAKGVTFGTGINTASYTGTPAYGTGFLTVNSSVIPSSKASAIMATFNGQVQPGLDMSVSNNTDKTVQIVLWSTPRKIGD